MNDMHILKASIDNESTTFQASDTAAGYLIPEVWSRRIEEFAKAKLVIAPLGVTNTELLNTPGDVVNIAVDSELTAAALTESVKASVASISYSQVTVTPSERGIAVSVTRKTLIRAFNDVMSDQSRIMGYALAKLKDSLVAATCVGSAGTTLIANGVVLTDLASTDQMDTDDIANAISTMRNDDREPKFLVIHPAVENSLIRDSNFIDASKFGGREVVLNGQIGRYLGLAVLETTIIPVNGTDSDAFDNLLIGDRAFVIAEKMRPTFDSKYEPLDRAFTLIAVEDYGVSILNANAVVVMVSHKGI